MLRKHHQTRASEALGRNRVRRATATGLAAMLVGAGFLAAAPAGAQSGAPSWCGLPSEQLGEDSKAVCATFGFQHSRSETPAAPSWCGLASDALGADSLVTCQSFGLHLDPAPAPIVPPPLEPAPESAPPSAVEAPAEPQSPVAPVPVEPAADDASAPLGVGQGNLLQPIPVPAPDLAAPLPDAAPAPAPADDAATPAEEVETPAAPAPVAAEEATDDVPVIVIDAGLGYISQENGKQKWQGPLLVPGVVEDELSLDISNRVARLLEVATSKEFEVVMTREGDAAPFAPMGCPVPCEADLLGRVDLAKSVDADLLVSIRTNGHSLATSNGTETYWSPSWPGFATVDAAALPPTDLAEVLLAERIHTNLVGLGLKDRGVKAKTYDVISYRGFPSVRVQVGFHSNTVGADNDASRLADPVFRQSAARAIFEAIEAGF